MDSSPPSLSFAATTKHSISGLCSTFRHQLSQLLLFLPKHFRRCRQVASAMTLTPRLLLQSVSERYCSLMTSSHWLDVSMRIVSEVQARKRVLASITKTRGVFLLLFVAFSASCAWRSFSESDCTFSTFHHLSLSWDNTLNTSDFLSFVKHRNVYDIQ